MIKCIRCNGGGAVWGSCCSGLANECGCMGMPVDIPCYLCNGSGVLEKQLTETEIAELQDFILDQNETTVWYEEIINERKNGKKEPGRGYINITDVFDKVKENKEDKR